jgi:hypothetical protein
MDRRIGGVRRGEKREGKRVEETERKGRGGRRWGRGYEERV